MSMPCKFAEATRAQWAATFNQYGGDILRDHADLVAAWEKFAGTCHRAGVLTTTKERYVACGLDAIANDLPEEVVDYIGAG